MTWLVWRQHRGQFLSAAAVLLVLTAGLLITGLSIQSSYVNTGLASCLARDRSACADLVTAFQDQYSAYMYLLPLFLILPGLLGVFWGAPLVAREVEQGTHRLAWTQSVSRTRWVAVKVLALAGALLVGVGLFTVVLGWWSGPALAASGSRFQPGIFDLLGVAPLGYGLFAFALGVAAGTAIHRTVPAMACTFAIFAAVRAFVALVLRPRYLPEQTASYALGKDGGASQLGAWVTSARTVDSAGRLVSHGLGIEFDLVKADCPGLQGPASGAPPDPAAFQACIHNAGIHVVATLQPASRYWLFQGIEVTLFLLLAAALLTYSVWAVRRRLD